MVLDSGIQSRWRWSAGMTKRSRCCNVRSRAGAGAPDAWFYFEVEPAYDGLRDDPRFIEMLALVRAQAQAERRELERLRAAGLVPDRETDERNEPAPTRTADVVDLPGYGSRTAPRPQSSDPARPPRLGPRTVAVGDPERERLIHLVTVLAIDAVHVGRQMRSVSVVSAYPVPIPALKNSSSGQYVVIQNRKGGWAHGHFDAAVCPLPGAVQADVPARRDERAQFEIQIAAVVRDVLQLPRPNAYE